MKRFLCLLVFIFADVSADQLSGYADWLFWNVRRDGLDYAIPYDGTNAVGKVHEVCPNYSNGSRFGIHDVCDCVIYTAEYTHYQQSATDSMFDLVNGDIAGTQTIDQYNVTSPGNISTAAGKYDLSYDAIDLTIGTESRWNDCLSTVFFVGAKLVFVDQRFNTFYSQETTITGNLDTITQKVEFDAYGTTLGLHPKMQYGCFNLVGTLSLDTFLTKVDRHFKYETSTDGGISATQRANLRDECWRLMSTVNLVLGVEYDVAEIIGHCGEAKLSFGYEFHHWFSAPGFMEHQNESGEITFDRSTSSLGFDGLFVRLAATF